jgi:hypothetical protein
MSHFVKNRVFLLTVLGAVYVVSFFYQPLGMDGIVLCPFRLLTGISCPGCGLTRAFCEISRGHIFDSFVCHPLGWLVYFYGLLFAAILAFETVTGHNISGLAPTRLPTHKSSKC